MEQINRAIDRVSKNQAQAGRQLKPTFDQLTTQSFAISKVNESEKNKLAQIEFIVGEVENSKQVHLSDAERISLVTDLFKLGESIEQIHTRGELVKKITTYGKISFDLWYNALPVFTGAEINRELNRRQDKRRRAYLEIDPHADDEQLAREGLESIHLIYARKREEKAERILANLKNRCRKARIFAMTCSEELRREILDIAVAKGVIVKDEYWAQVLPICTPKILDEIESIMKRMSA